METVAISDGGPQIARWRRAIIGGKPETQASVDVTNILILFDVCIKVWEL
jgi:hypothetical protein